LPIRFYLPLSGIESRHKEQYDAHLHRKLTLRKLFFLTTVNISSPLTPTYAKDTQSQISFESGLMKESTEGDSFFGLYTMIEIPSDINGFVKSITRSLSDEIVNAEIAMSAS
jgi:hypothetical protein